MLKKITNFMLQKGWGRFYCGLFPIGKLWIVILHSSEVAKVHKLSTETTCFLYCFGL